jgi:hypothetical protein
MVVTRIQETYSSGMTAFPGPGFTGTTDGGGNRAYAGMARQDVTSACLVREAGLRREGQQILGVFQRPVAGRFGIENGDFRDAVGGVADVDIPAVRNILDDGFPRKLDVKNFVKPGLLPPRASVGRRGAAPWR